MEIIKKIKKKGQNKGAKGPRSASWLPRGALGGLIFGFGFYLYSFDFLDFVILDLHSSSTQASKITWGSKKTTMKYHNEIPQKTKNTKNTNLV